MNRTLAISLVFLSLVLTPSRLTAQLLMSGNFAYSASGNVVTFGVTRIDNYNPSYTTSGTLAIQLWATSAPYYGNGSLFGYKLTEVAIGQLQGGYYFYNIVKTATISYPPPGYYYIVFVLAQWNGFQYLIQDYGNFPTIQPINIIAPTIQTPPQNTTVAVGQSVTFNVAVNGTPPFTYQWFRNGSPISGAVGSTYTIASVKTSDVANYSVVVSNPGGSSTSAAAALTVTGSPPTISVGPQNVTAVLRQTVSFSVTVAGTPPFTYTWYRNGNVLPGATGSSIVIPNVQTNYAGTYTVYIVNSAGTASSGAVLTVTPPGSPPTIGVTPTPQTVLTGSSASFAVYASGSGPLSYQWRKNGTNIPGATSAILSLGSAQPGDAGNYSVIITNSAGIITSSPASLAVTNQLGQTETAQIFAHGRSFGFLTSSRTITGFGAVSMYYTSPDGRTDLFPLSDTVAAGIQFSGEAKRTVPGTYQTDYASLQVSSLGWTEYGTITVNVPEVDANANGLPDFLEFTNSVNVAVTGNIRSDWPSVIQANLKGLFTRSANQRIGNYSLTNQSSLEILQGTWSILYVSGTIAYQRPANTCQLSLSSPDSLGAVQTATTHATITQNGANTLAISPFTLATSEGFTSSTSGPATLVRNGRRYLGTLTYSGSSRYSWSTSTDWVVEVVDPNDATGNGVPDLTKALLSPPLLQVNTQGFTMTLPTQIGYNYKVESSTNLVNWQTLTNFTPSTSAIQITDSPGSHKFYRITVP